MGIKALAPATSSLAIRVGVAFALNVLVPVFLFAFSLLRLPKLLAPAPEGMTSSQGSNTAPPVDLAPGAVATPPLGWSQTASLSNEAGWPHDPSGTAWFRGGEYQLYARDPGRFVAVGAPTAASFDDVVVTAQFRKVGGPPGGGYGIIVRNTGPAPLDGRNQGGRYYMLEAGDQREFGVWRRDDDRWIDLVPWTPSPAVRPGDA